MLNVIISLITEPSSKLPENTGSDILFASCGLCSSKYSWFCISRGSRLFICCSQMLCKTNHAYISAGTRSSSKSVFLVRNPHRAFSLANAHSMGFLAERNMLLKTTCALVLHVSYSFMQCGVSG